MNSVIEKSQPFLKFSTLGLLALASVVIYLSLWSWAKQYAPPEGHIFERLPALEGIYVEEPCNTRRCGRSFLNGEPISCWSIFFFDPSQSSCGGSIAHNGGRVSIEKILIPIFGEGWVPAISSFTLETRQSDMQIRDQWLDKTQLACAAITLVCWFLLTFVYVASCIQDFIKKSDVQRHVLPLR
jgi:hypothetical protein